MRTQEKRLNQWAVFIISITTLGCSEASKNTSNSGFEFGEAAANGVGPFDVGLRTIVFEDENNRNLTADIWYPAIAEDADELAVYEPTIYSRTAYREPKAAVHAAPLVAFSHGLGGIRYQSVYFCERLASHGFAVVAVDHPLSTMFDIDQSQLFESVNNRPEELKSAVDAALDYSQKHPNKLKIKGENYIVSGHSLGTHTAFAVAGGQTEIESFLSICDERPHLTGCNYRDQYDPTAFRPDHGDERVIGVMPMSPGFWHLFGEAGTELAVLKNSFSLVGDRDPVLLSDTELLPTVNALGNPKRAAIFHDAGHYGFSEMCDFAPFLSPECVEENQGWADIDQVHTDSNTLIVAYVGWTHTEEESYLDWLSPQQWQNTNISIIEYD